MARAKAKTATARSGGKSRGRKSKAKTGKHAAGKIEVEIAMAGDTTEIPDNGTPDTLVLPDALDSSSALSIKELLIARRGAPVVVDAGQVRRVGAQALQVLIAAGQTWKADGQSYVVTNASSELLDTIALVGLSREHLFLEGIA